jgi:hypothetical protein
VSGVLKTIVLCNLNKKFPVPKRTDIVEWVENAYTKITKETIRKNFLRIGYYHPDDNNLDIDAELKSFCGGR